VKTLLLLLLALASNAGATSLACIYPMTDIEINVHTKEFPSVFHWTENGLTHKIYIKDPINPNPFDDYITIKNNKNQVITYPLSCRRSK
jgi:hypothetical protein